MTTIIQNYLNDDMFNDDKIDLVNQWKLKYQNELKNTDDQLFQSKTKEEEEEETKDDDYKNKPKIQQQWFLLSKKYGLLTFKSKLEYLSLLFISQQAKDIKSQSFITKHIKIAQILMLNKHYQIILNEMSSYSLLPKYILPLVDTKHIIIQLKKKKKKKAGKIYIYIIQK